MSDNNLAQEKFEEGMADFVSHNYGRSIDLLSHDRVPGTRFFYVVFIRIVGCRQI